MKVDWVTEALKYRKMGISVFACWADKKPIQSWKAFQNRLPTSREIRFMFSRPGVGGIAAVCGAVSGGLVCRDYDDPKAFSTWKKKHRDIVKSFPTVATKRGSHIWLYGPNEWHQMTDGEYRGTSKQYVMLPPSIHPESPEPYRWIIHPDDVGFPITDNTSDWGLLSTILVGKKSDKDKGKIDSYISSSKFFLITNTNSGQKLPRRSVMDADGFGWMLPDSVRKLAVIHQPVRVGHRNQKIMNYVRALLRLPGMRWNRFRLTVAFRQWWGPASLVVGTKEEKTSLRDFMDAWELCPEQRSGLDVARLRKAVEPFALPDVGVYLSGDAELLFKCCVHLQGINGGGEFFISGDDAGRLIGSSRASARRALQRLIGFGLLEQLWKGSNLSGRSNGYRCLPPSR